MSTNKPISYEMLTIKPIVLLFSLVLCVIIIQSMANRLCRVDESELERAFQKGDLPEIKRIVEWRNLRLCDLISLRWNPLSIACENGHLKVIVWIFDHFKCTLDELRLLRPTSFVEFVCQCGSVEILQFLVERFNVPRDDILRDCCSALRHACARGNLPMAKLLVSQFRLTSQDVKKPGNEILFSACLSGNLETPLWFIKEFEVTKEEARAEFNLCFHLVCGRGELKIAQWMAEFGI